MNLAPFFRRFRITHDDGNAPLPASIRKKVDDEFLLVFEQCGGKTFNHGIFRVYRGDQIARRTVMISRMFRAIRGQAVAFGADWLGRQFVLDFSEVVRGKPTVVCLEPGVPDSFCTDQSILAFCNDTLVKKADAALARNLFREWRATSNIDIRPDQCVGYRVPLFLNGKDTLRNLELTDMEVYLDLCTQLWDRVKDLPEGTSIDHVSMEEKQRST